MSAEKLSLQLILSARHFAFWFVVYGLLWWLLSAGQGAIFGVLLAALAAGVSGTVTQSAWILVGFLVVAGLTIGLV